MSRNQCVSVADVCVSLFFFSLLVLFPHVVEPGDVLVLGEELGRRLLLQVVCFAGLGRHVFYLFIIYVSMVVVDVSSSLFKPLSLFCSRGSALFVLEQARECASLFEEKGAAKNGMRRGATSDGRRFKGESARRRRQF